MKKRLSSTTDRLASKDTVEPHTPATLATLLPSPTPTLTTIQAAEFLNVKPSTMEQHRWRGCGCRFVKIGRSVRYRLADLEAFLEERSFSSTTEAQASETA